MRTGDSSLHPAAQTRATAPSIVCSCGEPAIRVGNGRLPGEGGVWFLIAGDVVLFSFLFVIFLYYRVIQHDVFIQGHAQLNQGLGLSNTLLMLTSSWLVATGVRAARQQRELFAARCFALALLGGLGFVVVKGFEYGEKINADLTLTSNDFFMLYFACTGIHLIHVLIGMAALTAMIFHCRSGVQATKVRNLETGASFWHLVDMLWIVLFALIYLMSGL